MPKEIDGQIISGNAMSEKDCLLHFVEHMRQAKASINGLAHLRKDIRYKAIEGIIEEVMQKALLLAQKPNGIIIPKNIRN